MDFKWRGGYGKKSEHILLCRCFIACVCVCQIKRKKMELQKTTRLLTQKSIHTHICKYTNTQNINYPAFHDSCPSIFYTNSHLIYPQNNIDKSHIKKKSFLNSFS